MRLIIAGGGSGGHIYPAIAIVKSVRDLVGSLDVLYIGTNHGLERDLVPRQNIPFATIHAKGLLVKGLNGKMQGIWAALRGLLEAMGHIRRFKPDVVVGTGGYVSGPVGLAAVLMGVPLVLQEQNVWPGFTNRTLGPRAKRVIVPFEEAKKYFRAGTSFAVIPNPVVITVEQDRAALRQEMDIAADQVVILATGGSQGAEAINRFWLQFLPRFQEHPEWVLLWATGRRYYTGIMEQLNQIPTWNPKQVRVFEYFYEIQKFYRISDIFLGRAGAMTIADCTAFGLPSILVPSPHVSEDHQTKNAQVIANRQAGILIPEPDLLKRGETELIAILKDRDRRGKMASAALAIYDPLASEKIARTILEAHER
ncbi:undecaprenyldiphospho-muramoylpentapeptide beta-N-acetylglucosaminyltransferase [Sulfobacillus thermosulfidooxidans]|uniref:undecaprenyldiphospho-muramoylpentapeptide beta-N-acetylglucosaminyltransferase n=1 Tax=Sulfobacillus thermosulfidooxidans TaxID=28034 RepID=UPI0003118768|nr:undecaprenyldiphospho-muramoylpentapeptide beta-N-acetylglucosaminyltransferase [Sulfobacillus thermosulfidooxidans]OLZ09801.1 undecaprenyldiphospho-muramoylpentapeptide beta-N-acetylglucosaminyltransferase [Sulfobacillus thermosulfidooxidans]OLZ15893.1 undecaprenyldiphospho-muramoylpentapeptide beta-N-acetylglucosaminyltransferase [Sulfobacillus thermosulfidooxidans]OLZ18260.1 undecaprenyldiphospho-muramoylpentapeptide beta-N-acetylglucosaminyltransferase [Sulfobacillus thermosulfidooxidans]